MFKNPFEYVMIFAYAFVLQLKTVLRFLGFCVFLVMPTFYLSAFFSLKHRTCMQLMISCVCGLFFNTAVSYLKISLAFRC